MCAHTDVFVREAEYLNLEMTKEEQNISKKTKTLIVVALKHCGLAPVTTGHCHSFNQRHK